MPVPVPQSARDNVPSRNLYEQLGFGHGGDEEVIPSLWVTRHMWALTRRCRLGCPDLSAMLSLVAQNGAVCRGVLAWIAGVAGLLLAFSRVYIAAHYPQ